MDDLAGAISSMPEEMPFNSCKVPCRHFRIEKATCLWSLHDMLDLKTFHLSQMPHALSINQTSEKVSHLKLLLTALRESMSNRFPRIITGNESRFFFFHPRDPVWAESPDELPQHTEQKIDMEKCLVWILWSVDGIHGPFHTPKGTTYGRAFFTNAVIPNFIENVWSGLVGRR
jgi:hypothetical protein